MYALHTLKKRVLCKRPKHTSPCPHIVSGAPTTLACQIWHTSAYFVEASCPSLGLLAYGGAPGLYKAYTWHALIRGHCPLYAWASCIELSKCMLCIHLKKGSMQEAQASMCGPCPHIVSGAPWQTPIHPFGQTSCF